MRRVQRLSFALLALVLVAGMAFGQGTTSALNGRVEHDGSGLPGVTVTISSPSMQGSRVSVTDVNGNYNFTSIPPGDYTVEFTMDGMAAITRTVRVNLARTERVNAEMQLSSVAEAITVTAAAPAVLETTEIQSNFTNDQVEDLPVGRTVQNIVSLSAGVNTNGPGASPRQANPPITISGAFAFDSLFLINGAVTNENIRGQTDNLFIEDAIEETTVMTGSISAEYGRFTGGVVSAITKSGGNEFSGSFRDSFTNPSWTSVTPRGEAKAESSLNQTYEGTLGGRVVRDRLWFFGAGRYFEQDITGFFTNSTTPRPTTIETDERMEGKLTGQLAPGHSLVGSYLSYEIDQTPHCAFGCWDLATMDIDGRQLPREMMTGHYSGIITSDFLIEANYSTRDLVFSNSGGTHVTTDFTDPRDIALGSWAYDLSFGGAWGAPIFCGICDDEIRENEFYQLKGTYYLATAATGTHNIVAGYENFAESRFANNYQSGSNFDLYIYNGIAPTRTPDGELRPVVTQGDVIQWVPIFALSEGSDFVTESLFINDKWDLNPNWSFNVGARFDRNDGVDSAGNSISKDENLSPRIGVIYDVRGDGRLRVNGSYSRYVSKIQEGIGGAIGGGNPAYFQYEYRGPTIGGPDSGLGSFDVLEQVFAWFLANGGTGSTEFLVGAGVPGVNQFMPGDLRSPNVDEFTLGVGTQIGNKGFFRADYIDRAWGDFYGVFTSPGVQVPAPGSDGDFLDLQTFGNTDDLERTHQAVQLQASYRFMPRLNFGGNYTWSQTEGNSDGENAGSGPTTDLINAYREYKAFAAHNPTGALLSDQEHKARLWASFDQPLGAFGNLNLTVLERFDSGTPYSAVTIVPVRELVSNPGYATPPGSVTYYFSERGEFRWEDATATDLALNWAGSVRGLGVFIQGEVINVFDESAQINGSTAIGLLDSFDPFTEAPVEGVHWQKQSSFGSAASVNHYQLPRTYRISAGFKF
ncbi:MAG TPA: TonB-dependent receptor [Thermoanaerobaculia bacterium]|nr:TonB-dependent receptor [Thermoanaerobaculia bacterium]